MFEDGEIGAIPLNKGALVLGARFTGERRCKCEAAQGQTGQQLSREAHIGCRDGLETNEWIANITPTDMTAILYRHGIQYSRWLFLATALAALVE